MGIDFDPFKGTWVLKVGGVGGGGYHVVVIVGAARKTLYEGRM